MDTQNKKFLIARTASNFLLLSSIFILVLTYGSWVIGNGKIFVAKARGISWQSPETPDKGESSFIKAIFNKKPLAISPINREFSIVIPRIGLSVPVVKNVSVSDKDEYINSLKSGVAHAKNTALPGKSGNSYYFAHSSINFWELGPYATSFNLLNLLAPGDLIYIYYNDKEYTYKILQTEKVKGWDTAPYYRDFVRPMLTLQTCDPPGTTLNRLLVLAELYEE
jgi:sortase A